MAQQRRNAPAEPVNSEQAAALEDAERKALAEASSAAPQGPTAGELEERTVEAELRAEQAERKAETLESELATLREQVSVLMRAARTQQQMPDKPGMPQEHAGGVPVFDEDSPHGIVVGDAEVAYVQDGHQFGRDRQYLRTEKNRGCPRPFNPRLIGLTKPRPGQKAGDALDGFRDRDDR